MAQLTQSQRLYVIAGAMFLSAALLGGMWAFLRVFPLLWAAGLDALFGALMLFMALRRGSESRADNENRHG